MPNLAGHYEAPFCPATKTGEPRMCVSCGTYSNADKQISEYPFRFIPRRWSLEAKTQGLRCEHCTRDQKIEPEFYNKNDVWMQEEEAGYHRHNETKITLTTVRRDQRVHREDVQHKTTVALDEINVDRDDKGALFYTDGAGRRYVLEEQEMEETETEETVVKTRGQRLKKQGREVGSAFGAGLQLAAANEAGEILVDIAKELTSELPMAQLALDHPDGREVAKVLVALMLHTGVSQTNIIPQGAFIGEACKLQMTASSFTLLAPRLNKMRKHLTALAKIGEQAAEAQGVQVRVYTQDEMDDAYAEMEAELQSLKARMAEAEQEVEQEVAEASAPKNGKSRKKSTRKSATA
jgi:hypothetical protein